MKDVKNIEKKKLLIDNFKEMKEKKEKITMVTAYSYIQSMIAEEAGIDVVLVGDSLGNVELGYENTISVTMEDMLMHLKSARSGAMNTHIIVDMPFMSYNTSIEKAIENAGMLYQQGRADSVKLEGGKDYTNVIGSILRAGIPVCGHIGLTPQTSNLLGGFKVQGKTLDIAKKLFDDALALQDAGAFMIVVEAIPQDLAAVISEKVSIPIIGIGGGVNCDGQVLVFHDLMGLYKRFTPKFVKVYANVYDIMEKAMKEYIKDVREAVFPDAEHSFSMKQEIIDSLKEII
jgi:3-methyl-2-oxobutanoate hydroxymethyltransferase